jgi:hypothetical protein
MYDVNKLSVFVYTSVVRPQSRWSYLLLNGRNPIIEAVTRPEPLISIDRRVSYFGQLLLGSMCV